MWPFDWKRKKKMEEDETREALAKIKSFRDIGDTFQYMGITMTVTGHGKYELYDSYTIKFIPALHAEYVNKAGDIKSTLFTLRELPGLMRYNV